MTEQTKPIGDILIIGCGGAGSNIISPLEAFRNQNESGMASLNNVYVDTSRANIRPMMPEDKVYIAKSSDSTDGSGKERSHNAEVIMKHSKDILQKHKPGYLTVLVSSLSGGSGAVIAASLANELLSQGKMVIVIAVGVADSGVEIKNTKQSLATFEGLVKANKKSLAVAYFENSRATPASAVDAEIIELITAISLVFSRQNEGLDTRDLHNFLNVDALTSHKAQVVGLECFVGSLDPADHETTITVASVVAQQDNRGIDFVLPYVTYGLMNSEVSTTLSQKGQIHLVTKSYPFNKIQHRLNEHLDEMERAANASTAQSELLDGNENLAGGFMVL